MSEWDPCQDSEEVERAIPQGLNVTTTWLVPFLRALTRHLRGAVIVVWDRLPGHRAQVVTAYLHRQPRDVALLPAYAPQLNPVEILWAYLKSNPLANFAASDPTWPASRLTMCSPAPPSAPALVLRSRASLVFSEIGHYLRRSQ